MKLYGEFLPELKNYQSISMLHSLLCTYGFKKKMAKASAEVHIFQHQDFTREHCNKGNDCDCSKTDLLPVTPQQKRALKKKRRNDGVVVQNNPAISPKASTTALENTNKILPIGKQRRLLYHYINFDNPEFNILPVPDIVKEEHDTSENINENKTKSSVPSHPTVQQPGNQNKEDSLLRTSPSLSLGTPEKLQPNKSTQVSLDINKMLSICAAPLVPPLSPQPKC
eukprot:gi/632944802/ref/XP_007887700.1/ PREDICTED: uncharacterized protein C16orf86 homolog isoform X2 [Callorhinchus milii]